MQLRDRPRGKVIERLAAASASLLTAAAALHGSCANAQNADAAYTSSEFGPGSLYSELGGAFLIYQETGGRVTAIEPSANLTAHGTHGEELTFGFTLDAVSGATPNGAVPSDQTQTFVTPLKLKGSCTTVTTASGGSQVVCLPPTQGQQQSAERLYTTPPNTLPVDKGFQDHRGAFDLGWSQPLGPISLVGFGAGYSLERDYQAITANGRIAQTFNASDSTLSFSINSEVDSSFPYGGIPEPLSAMDPHFKSINGRQKTQLGFVAGLTEVLTRRWLTQINYSYDAQDGYQSDPYRFISLIDAMSGEPTGYLYESRPWHRTSQSVFWDNKFDLGPTVTDLSFRYFKDNWGIASKTVELSERIDLTDRSYLQPSARWYQQTAANFFHYYLVEGAPLPAFASADTRLNAFTSTTFGLKWGYRMTPRTELDLSGGYYRQQGNGHPTDAIGQLKQQDLFGGTDAGYILLGYNWDFH